MNQDDFGYYHPETEKEDNFRKHKSTDYSTTSGGVFYHKCLAIWGWDGDDFPIIYGDTPPPIPKEIKCECGSDAVKATRHSDYCPKYKKAKDE